FADTQEGQARIILQCLLTSPYSVTKFIGIESNDNLRSKKSPTAPVLKPTVWRSSSPEPRFPLATSCSSLLISFNAITGFSYQMKILRHLNRPKPCTKGLAVSSQKTTENGFRNSFFSVNAKHSFSLRLPGR